MVPGRSEAPGCGLGALVQLPINMVDIQVRWVHWSVNLDEKKTGPQKRSGFALARGEPLAVSHLALVTAVRWYVCAFHCC